MLPMAGRFLESQIKFGQRGAVGLAWVPLGKHVSLPGFEAARMTVAERHRSPRMGPPGGPSPIYGKASPPPQTRCRVTVPIEDPGC